MTLHTHFFFANPFSLVQVQLTYSTEDGGKYSFYACFPQDSCGLDVDDCTVDISDENIVLLLKKELPEATSDAVSVCETVWEKFSVGLNAGQTTVSVLAWFFFFSDFFKKFAISPVFNYPYALGKMTT